MREKIKIPWTAKKPATLTSFPRWPSRGTFQSGKRIKKLGSGPNMTGGPNNIVLAIDYFFFHWLDGKKVRIA